MFVAFGHCYVNKEFLQSKHVITSHCFREQQQGCSEERDQEDGVEPVISIPPALLALIRFQIFELDQLWSHRLIFSKLWI